MSLAVLREAAGEHDASRIRRLSVRPHEREGREEVGVSLADLSQPGLDAIARRRRERPGMREIEGAAQALVRAPLPRKRR